MQPVKGSSPDDDDIDNENFIDNNDAGDEVKKESGDGDDEHGSVNDDDYIDPKVTDFIEYDYVCTYCVNRYVQIILWSNNLPTLSSNIDVQLDFQWLAEWPKWGFTRYSPSCLVNSLDLLKSS